VPEYTTLDLAAQLRSFGRGVIMYADKWDLVTPLRLTHLADTEGDIVVNTNGETASLTLPELTGPAAHETDFVGENPVIEVPVFLADPALHAIISPMGSSSGGRSRRGRVKEYTIAIFPEALFIGEDPVTNLPIRRALEFGGGVWNIDGNPLTAEEEELLGNAFWLWRASFTRPPRRFRGGAGDERKNIETVTIQGMYHPDMPDGHRHYTTGDPADADINLEGAS
jgi:hypothetical protein